MTTISKAFYILVILLSWNHLIAQTAALHMSKISKEFEKISKETWDYTYAIAHKKNAKLIEARRKDMLHANRNALKHIKSMADYKGDGSLRDSVARYLELSYLVLNEDYEKIVDMEAISEQSYDAMEAYMMAQEQANDKLELAFDVAANAQKEFAKNNNIILQENESKTVNKLEKASEVFRFYNKIFLVFYKPYKQELYLIDAQKKEDINAMKQNQESLSKLSKEAIEQLKTIKPYKNNTTLKASCMDVLEFYFYEADKKISPLIDFFLKKEKFDKLRTAMEKKTKQPTSTEINEFNLAVTEFNKASAEYNRINTELNNKRGLYLQNWSNAVERYLDRNVSTKK